VSDKAVTIQPDHITIQLQPDEVVVLLGLYDLELRKGTVVVNGALLRPGSELSRIYAPSTHSLPTIVAKSGAAEIVVHSVSNPALQKLAQLSPLWSKMWHEEIGQSAQRSFCLLNSSTDDPLRRSLSAIEVDDETQQALNKIMSTKSGSSSQTSVTMVTGPKGSGKSTFCRLLANTLLTAPQPWTKTTCFWLDLDPGQPEFGPPGQVSLVQLREPILGPPFSHVFTHPSSGSRNVRSHTIAAVSPKEDSNHFLACAKDLYNHYRQIQQDFESAPLIINCSGWIAGSAMPILLDLLRHTSPMDLVLMPPLDNATIASLQSSISSKTSLCILPVRPRAPQSRTSAELRAMQSMSYMHSQPPTSGNASWTLSPLSTIKPWRVSYGPQSTSSSSESVAGIAGILSYHNLIPASMLSTVLPASTVSIIAVTDDRAFFPQNSHTSSILTPNANSTPPHDLDALTIATPDGLSYIVPPSQIPTPLDPRHSYTLGQALVRGIDVEKGEILLLTPVPGAVIRRAQKEGDKIVLVRGKFDAPDWALLEDVWAADADAKGKRWSYGDEDGGGARSVDGSVGGSVAVGKGKRPYVALRKQDAGIGGGVWRVRHLPRRMPFGE